MTSPYAQLPAELIHHIATFLNGGAGSLAATNRASRAALTPERRARLVESLRRLLAPLGDMAYAEENLADSDFERMLDQVVDISMQIRLTDPGPKDLVAIRKLQYDCWDRLRRALGRVYNYRGIAVDGNWLTPQEEEKLEELRVRLENFKDHYRVLEGQDP